MTYAVQFKYQLQGSMYLQGHSAFLYFLIGKTLFSAFVYSPHYNETYKQLTTVYIVMCSLTMET